MSEKKLAGQSPSRLRVAGIDVDAVSLSEALDRFAGFMSQGGGLGRSRIIVTPNSEIADAASKNPELAEVIKEADLVLPDGVGLKMLSAAKGCPLPEKLAGIDFCYSSLKVCAKNGWKVFLLGGKPSVAEASAANLKRDIPGLEICGTADGYFSAGQESDVAEAIRQSGADYLVAGLGSPKQELFLYRHLEDTGCRACIAVGGSLDVWSGRLRRAPRWMTRCGLEWLYRLIQEPSRAGRILRIPAFIIRHIFKR